MTNDWKNYPPTEEQEQKALVEWMELMGIKYCHVPNEGKHKVQYLRKQALLGVKAGIPDILVFTAPPKAPKARGVAIEMKRRKGGRLSKSQEYWLDELRRHGWITAVCAGADNAIKLLESYGYGRR